MAESLLRPVEANKDSFVKPIDTISPILDKDPIEVSSVKVVPFARPNEIDNTLSADLKSLENLDTQMNLTQSTQALASGEVQKNSSDEDLLLKKLSF